MLDRMLRDRIICGVRSSRIPVLGELQLHVCYKGVDVDCSLTVLDCSGPCLCGRDLLAKLKDAGMSILQWAGHDSTAPDPKCSSSVNNIFSDYQDVFSRDLGVIKGPPASLQLKDGVSPKFCKARPIPYALQFTLVTDHQPLLGLLRADRLTPAMPAARIQRWALYLGGYRYKLHYVPGKQLLNSDALSRLPMLSTEPEDDEPPQGRNDWAVQPDSTVYVRNYGVGEKWTPGRVKTTTGARMATVETPTAVIRRHTDQVRPRHDGAAATLPDYAAILYHEDGRRWSSTSDPPAVDKTS
ncbi:uncharacterized protein LOC121048276 [Ixodes scapularis]|uniref:uncharacterized protein LOC121048276 n=1 Tax=Ixodes scapularis TaxID=6945 RepID=UPI001C3922D7|nr:uncharacterized protein LOC121048276 [Ixodes scapularis]